MPNFFPRTVFFVDDAVPALEYYTHTLGFTKDWVHEEDGLPYVFQVSLHGLQLIVNQKEGPNDNRAGHGRLFVGLDDDDSAVFWQHIRDKKIPYTITQWGAPTIVIADLDQNELYFWLSDAERARLQADE